MQAVIADMPKRWLDDRANDPSSQWDEMWDGVLYMPPMASYTHSDFAFDLRTYLKQHWEMTTGGRIHSEVNLTTPEDEHDWLNNFRIPDLMLLDPPRFAIRKAAYFVGAPLVAVEIYSPGDKSYEKLDFYAGLGVPEVWIIDRDSKECDLYILKGSEYDAVGPDAEGWFASAAVPVKMKPNGEGKLSIQMIGKPESLTYLPE